MFSKNIGLAYAGHELLEKNLDEGGPALTFEESSLRLSSMKKSKNTASRMFLECSEATGSERRTVSIAAQHTALVNRL